MFGESGKTACSAPKEVTVMLDHFRIFIRLIEIADAPRKYQALRGLWFVRRKAA